jgi:hypothetical protein
MAAKASPRSSKDGTVGGGVAEIWLEGTLEARLDTEKGTGAEKESVF